MFFWTYLILTEVIKPVPDSRFYVFKCCYVEFNNVIFHSSPKWIVTRHYVWTSRRPRRIRSMSNLSSTKFANKTLSNWKSIMCWYTTLLQDSNCLKTSLTQMRHKTTPEARSNKQCDRNIYQNNVAESHDILKLLPILWHVDSIPWRGTLWPICSCIWWTWQCCNSQLLNRTRNLELYGVYNFAILGGKAYLCVFNACFIPKIFKW